MKTWVILILLMVSTAKVMASYTDFEDEDRLLIPVTVSEGDEYDNDLFVKDNLVLPVKPQSKSLVHCCRTERVKTVLSSLGRITPSLALSTTGVILLELSKQNYLEAEVFHSWPFKFHFDKFFFPSAFFEAGRLNQSTAILMGLSKALIIANLWLPTTVITLGEYMRTHCCRHGYDSDDTNAKAVKMRMIVKGLCMACISSFGATVLIVNYNIWNSFFTKNTPMILEQLNLTGAIELCNKIPALGLAAQIDAYNFISAPCSPSLLKDMLIPTSNNLTWSLCERSLAGLSTGDYLMLGAPVVLIFLNLIYMMAWI